MLRTRPTWSPENSPWTRWGRCTPGWSCCRTCTWSSRPPSPGSGLAGCQTWNKGWVVVVVKITLSPHLLAVPPLVKGELLMFLPHTSLDTEPNKAYVPRPWFTLADNQNRDPQEEEEEDWCVGQSNDAHHLISLLTAAVCHQPLLRLGKPELGWDFLKGVFQIPDGGEIQNILSRNWRDDWGKNMISTFPTWTFWQRSQSGRSQTGEQTQPEKSTTLHCHCQLKFLGPSFMCISLEPKSECVIIENYPLPFCIDLCLWGKIF